MLVEFEVENTDDNRFTISGNGLLPESHDYDELPLQLGPLDNDEITAYFFIVTHNGDGNHGDCERFFPFTCKSLGFGNELKIKDYLGIYPNPSDGLVNFKNNQSLILQIEIYDLIGNRINNFDLSQHSVFTINLDEPDLYFYRANYGQSTVSGKFTIR